MLFRAMVALFVVAVGFQVAALLGRSVSDELGVFVLLLTVVGAGVPFVWVPGDRVPPATHRDPCPTCGYPLGAGGHDYAHEHHERTGRTL